jgi:hypothetical protein
VAVSRPKQAEIISSKGAGTLLKRRSPPTDLWPSVSGKRCSLIFVVPDIIAASFRQQLFKADTYASCVAASREVDQYVVGIEEKLVLRVVKYILI